MNEYLTGRIRELSVRARDEAYLTHTDFLSQSELAEVFDELRKDGELQVYTPPESLLINGTACVVYGGHQDADRNMLVFLPDYLTKEAWLQEEAAAGDLIQCLHVAPKNKKFADALTHRDYLGALMHLGIVREKTGDILCEDAEAYIFVSAEIVSVIAEELTRVKHTDVICEAVSPENCNFEQKYKELSGSVASERLDAVLAMAFRLSRGTAKELIDGENVMIDGRTTTDPGRILKAQERISVRGYGKFIYDGSGDRTKKGRTFAKVRIFA